mmetsp:Transcript_7432/g.16227  ORF Transcript_7432/g.16227 Transcript_7432/m.16227 type:complete len:150 (+) Transcript_7432:273-722(+)
MSSSSTSKAFAKHKSAVQNDGVNPSASGGAKMSWLARFLIFVFVPSFTGLTGLGVSYLQSLREKRYGGGGEDGSSGDDPHEVDFDRDFVTPFLLSLALVVVLGFQTGGFSTDRQPRGAFVWPKARKVQRVRRERVVVDDADADDSKKQQ